VDSYDNGAGLNDCIKCKAFLYTVSNYNLFCKDSAAWIYLV
jgi:hypothetical protein